MFVNAAYGLETATQAKQVFNTNLSAALGGTGADPATQPYAYLNYLVFDNNYVVKDGGAWRVPTTAGFDPGMEADPSVHKLVKFPSHIKPQQKGYIYIWVSNESENTKVWFDDLKVTHTKSRVVQASDYYAWGSTMREQRSPENPTYRYGYQGEFAEKDLETGWNHFELREYDPITGRWTSKDPMGQYHSPFVGMGNDPINRTDPDGGFDWVKNSEGRYYNDPNVNECTNLNGTGWEYVGKELPADINPSGLDILIKIDGAFYYQNTTNLFAKVFNSVTDGPKMVEHKFYDRVAENALGEVITNGMAAGGATYLFKGLRYLRNVRSGDTMLKGLYNSSEKGVMQAVEGEVTKLHNMYAQKAVLREAMLRGEKGAAQKFHEVSDLILQQEAHVNSFYNDMYKMFEN